MTERIPTAKLKALMEALERDGSVTFKNGSRVDWSAKQTGPEGEEVEGRIVVTRAGNATYRFTENELERAYAMALYGPAPIAQPSSETDFGDDPPF